MLSECWFFSGFFLPKGKFVIPWTVWFSLHTWQPENRQRKTAHKKKKKIYGHLKNLDTIEAGKISPSRDLNTWKKTAVDVGALWLFPNLFFFLQKTRHLTSVPSPCALMEPLHHRNPLGWSGRTCPWGSCAGCPESPPCPPCAWDLTWQNSGDCTSFF